MKTKKRPNIDGLIKTMNDAGPVLSASFDRSTVNTEERTVELSFSSEDPYMRWFGYEILGHNPEEVDLKRLLNDAPLLWMHIHEKQLGVIVHAYIKDGIGRAKVRFGQSDFANEKMKDVEDGILTKVSVGYVVNSMRFEQENSDGEDVYRVTKWTPHEVSLVTVPADDTVGIGRSFTRAIVMPKEAKQTKTKKQEKEMGEEAPVINVVEERKTAKLGEQKRSADILDLAIKHNQVALGQKAIADGKSVGDFATSLLDAKSQAPVESPANLELSPKEVKNFSLMRAINAYATGDFSKAGFERECSQAVAQNIGQEARGFYIPTDVQERDLTVGNSGDLVGTEHASDRFIDKLQNSMKVKELGANVLTGLVGDLEIPRESTSSQANWIATEDGDATQSEPTFDQVALSPKDIAVAVYMGRKLLKQSSPSIENMMWDKIALSLGLGVDKAALMGDGTNGAPQGIIGSTGVGVVTAGGLALDWAKVIDFETKASTANALEKYCAYLTNSSVRGSLKGKAKDAGSGRFIWEGKEVNGYAAHVTNQLPNTFNTDKASMIFGDFSQLFIGEWGVIDILPDPYSKSGKGGLILNAFMTTDIAIANPAAFAVATDILV